jgi:hypothetical protein
MWVGKSGAHHLEGLELDVCRQPPYGADRNVGAQGVSVRHVRRVPPVAQKLGG